jgi:Inner membrane protein YgaP-like, transmembrane domain
MKLENAVRIMAGTMVLISLGLARWVNEWWLLLTVFVGVNLIQSALTGFCPAEIILKKLGVGKSCEINPAIQPAPAKSSAN